MATRTFDPKQVVITVDGHTISGYADGEFVTAERNDDAWKLTVGADGEATRAKSNNRSGTLKIVLQQSSPSNDILTEIANQDEINNAGVVSASVRDMIGTTIASAEKVWVKKKPSTAFGKETGNREWILETGDLDLQVGGNAVA